MNSYLNPLARAFQLSLNETNFMKKVAYKKCRTHSLLAVFLKWHPNKAEFKGS